MNNRSRRVEKLKAKEIKRQTGYSLTEINRATQTLINAIESVFSDLKDAFISLSKSLHQEEEQKND